MKAVILAAGRGSRLKNMTASLPKPLVEFRGRRLIDWQIDALNGAGLNEISIVRGYRGECFDLGVHYFENYRWSASNMVVSLTCAKEWLENNTVIVSYGDIVYDKKVIEQLINAPGDITISYDPFWLSQWQSRFEDPLDDAETFRLNHDGTLIEIGQKPESLKQIEGQYMGLLKFTPTGWKTIERYLNTLKAKVVDGLDMTSLLQRLIEKDTQINTVAINTSWYEIDQPSDLNIY